MKSWVRDTWKASTGNFTLKSAGPPTLPCYLLSAGGTTCPVFENLISVTCSQHGYVEQAFPFAQPPFKHQKEFVFKVWLGIGLPFLPRGASSSGAELMFQNHGEEVADLPHSIPSEVLAGPASLLLAQEMLLSCSKEKTETRKHQGSCYSRFVSLHAQCS